MQLGNLIDFEVEGEDGRFLPRLRSLSHIGFPWLYDRNRLLVWHNFITRFELHLQDTGEIDPFYYDLLLSAAKKWHRQNPKRIVVESYLQLLAYEGRLYPQRQCYICEGEIGEQAALMQAFKPAHPHCIYAPALPSRKIFELFESQKTVFLEDNEVELLYETVMKGF